VGGAIAPGASAVFDLGRRGVRSRTSACPRLLRCRESDGKFYSYTVPNVPALGSVLFAVTARVQSVALRTSVNFCSPVNAEQVVPCSKQFVHDWKECSFAHEGETARRRHP
jgi:hypothetical protein